MYTKNAQTRNLYALLGLFRQQWGPKTSGISRLWPIYDYRKKHHFFTPLIGWKTGSSGFVYPLTPLLGIRTGSESSGGWLFPLWTHRRNRLSGNISGTFLWGRYWHRNDSGGSGIFPLYSYHNYGQKPAATSSSNYSRIYGKTFWSLPFCWYHNKTITPSYIDINTISTNITETRIKSHGIFPLYSCSTTKYTDSNKTETLNSHGSLLLFLYDYKHEKQPARDNTEAIDYTRRRILWHLWHYERENDNVSVDIFPAITYDRRTDGFRKFSFLWHFLRYENGPRGRKLDVLFIPFIRKNIK
jgi:hypothetical protein